MKIRCLASLSLAAALFVPTVAIAAANTVFIDKDASGTDKSINISITDANDIAALKSAFGSGLTLNDASQSFTIDCAANDSCLVSFQEDGAMYRQSYDELIKGFDLSAASASDLFGAKWDTKLEQSSCDSDNGCSHFEIKRFQDAAGKFMLRCNARVMSSGERLAPNCFLRFNIADVLRAERG